MMSAERKVEEKRVEVPPEKLEMSLAPELVKMIDEVVNDLGFDSREELVRYTIRNMLNDPP